MISDVCLIPQSPSTLPKNPTFKQLSNFEYHWTQWLVHHFNNTFILVENTVYYKPKLDNFLQKSTSEFYERFAPLVKGKLKLSDILETFRRFEFEVPFYDHDEPHTVCRSRTSVASKWFQMFDKNFPKIFLKHFNHWKVEYFLENNVKSRDLVLIERDQLYDIKPNCLIIAWSDRDRMYGRGVVLKNILEFADFERKKRSSSSADKNGKSGPYRPSTVDKVEVNFIDYHYIEPVTVDKIYKLSQFEYYNFPNPENYIIKENEMKMFNELLTGPPLTVEIRLSKEVNARILKEEKSIWKHYFEQLLQEQEYQRQQREIRFRKDKYLDSTMKLLGHDVVKPLFRSPVKIAFPRDYYKTEDKQETRSVKQGFDNYVILKAIDDDHNLTEKVAEEIEHGRISEEKSKRDEILADTGYGTGPRTGK